MGSSTMELEEALRSADELVDYDTSNRKCFYVLREQPARTGDRIRLTELGKVLPLRDIRNNQIRNLDKDTYFIETEGNFFPDFIEEYGIYLAALPFLEYLQSRLNLGNIEYNRIVINVNQDNRSEEYALFIPEVIDAVIEGSTRYDKNNILEFLEIDEKKVGQLEIFKLKDFPHLIVTAKLNRLAFTGYECLRLENFFNYEAERDCNYRERLQGTKLAAVIKNYERLADATSDINYRFSLRRLLYQYYIEQEIRQNLQKFCDSQHGFPLAVEKLSDRFLLFCWSWEDQTIQLLPEQAEYFEYPGFTLSTLGPVVQFINQLPQKLVEPARAVCWETILKLMLAESQIFAKYPDIHGEQRFRIYLHQETSRSLNPALIYDYQSPFQKRMEAANAYQDQDLLYQDLREIDFSNKTLTGKRIEGCDLRRANFTNAALNGTEFSNCDLAGVDFSQSRLGQAKFICCNLERSQFRQSDLQKVQFVQCNLWHAGFIKSDLTGAVFEKINLEQVLFYKSKLGGAIFDLQEIARDTSFALCDLKNTVFNGSEDETVIYSCDFRNTDLSGSRFTMAEIYNSNFTKAKLTQTDFNGCSRITGSNFRYCSCVELNLAEVTVEECDFSWVDLSWIKPKAGVDFVDCDFTHTNLAGFDFGVGGYKYSNILLSTNLSNCWMEQSDFSASKLLMTNFNGAKIKDSKFTQEQLECLELTAMQLREVKIIAGEDIK
ncbi:MAG: hypothetical protein GXY86_07600 [Firmicutes bacterium]|nr:hypothetical protein [Bacillota bacterium]